MRATGVESAASERGLDVGAVLAELLGFLAGRSTGAGR